MCFINGIDRSKRFCSYAPRPVRLAILEDPWHLWCCKTKRRRGNLLYLFRYDIIPVGSNPSRGWPFANTQTHTYAGSSLETMQAPSRRGGTAGVVPTIRMLSGLPDVVLTHVHRPPGRGGACSTACDTGSAGSERHGTKGDAINVIEAEGGDPEQEQSVAVFLLFFLFSLSRRRRYFTPRRLDCRLACSRRWTSARRKSRR